MELTLPISFCKINYGLTSILELTSPVRNLQKRREKNMDNIWKTHESENWFLENNWAGMNSFYCKSTIHFITYFE